jgi:hypothetical protein
MNAQEVANTIIDQIKATDRSALMSWAARGFKYSSKELGSLTFMVSNNPKVKSNAFVEVTLMGNDTYTVSVYRMQKGEQKIIKVVEEVYCDMLVDIIDNILG